MNSIDSSRRGFLRSACGHCLGLGALARPAGASRRNLLDDQGAAALHAARGRHATRAACGRMMDREESRCAQPADHPGRRRCRPTSRPGLPPGEGHCPDIRVYPVRMPQFNAMMAPNGMMIVWSGLMLRAENEAQLAAVARARAGPLPRAPHGRTAARAKDNGGARARWSGWSAASARLVGQIGLAASMFAFSREHEARADRMGMRLMQHAGYDGREAATRLGQPAGGNEGHRRQGRRQARRHLRHAPGHRGTAATNCCSWRATAGGTSAKKSYRKAIAPLRFGWLQDEIKRGQYEESLVLFDRMLDAGRRTTRRCCMRAARSIACATTAATPTRALADLDARRRAHRRRRRPRPSARWACSTSSGSDTAAAARPSRTISRRRRRRRTPAWCAATSRS